VHGAALQRGAMRERHAIDHEVVVRYAFEPLTHGLAIRQKARPQLIRDGSQAQVEARRLELLVAQRRGGDDAPVARGVAQVTIGENAPRPVGHPSELASVARVVPRASARARPSTPAFFSAASTARATALPSPAATASSEGPAPLRTQPSAPARRAASATVGIHGNNARRYG